MLRASDTPVEHRCVTHLYVLLLINHFKPQNTKLHEE